MRESFRGYLSPGRRFEPPQKCLLVQMVLEGFAPVDEYDWNFFAELGVSVAVVENIHFAKFKRLRGPQSSQLGFDGIAQAASGFGKEHNFCHHDQPELLIRATAEGCQARMIEYV